MSVLVDHSTTFARCLASLMRPLIDKALLVILYELTTVRAHGQSKLRDDVRQRSMPKEGAVARQVMLSLV